jgi:polyferredoxin
MATVGLFTRMTPGFAGHFVGFGAFLLAAALAAIGFVRRTVRRR